MQPKFTLLRIGGYLKIPPMLLILLLLISGVVNSQTYVNSNLSTGTTSSGGTVAPAGYTWSELQIALGGNTLGQNANIDVGTSVADDFTVPPGVTWNLTKLTVYGYQTGFAGTTSPFNRIFVRIHSSNPLSGPTTIVYGDLTTNRFAASSEAMMYRIGTTADQARKIWAIEANVSVSLPAGTYWIEYRTGITTAGAHFLPPGTVAGTMTQPGNNAILYNTTAWVAMTDGTPLVPQDMPFRLDYTASGSPCTTPTPGNTLSTATTACAGTNFTLSLQNTTGGVGVTYQWQSSPNNTTWTDIPGATSATLIRNHSATTWYRAIVTCATGPTTGTSTPIQVALTPATSCYCIPPNTDCTDNDVILRVRIGTLDNSSTCSAPTGYTNYTTTVAPTDVVAGAPNPMTVNTGVGFSKAVGVWIDYNKNGQFEATEFTSLGTGVAATDAITGNIAIPANATLGQTRMRVRLRFVNTAFTGAQACTNPSGFGETEDYLVNIVPCVQGTITTQPTNKTIVCAGTTTFSVAATGSLLTWQWQQRTSATAPWTNVTNGGVFSGATTATLTLTDAPVSMNGYQYRVIMTGACTAADFSTAATLTVTPLVATTTPATSATICAGGIQALTITNSAAAPTSVSFTSGAVSIPIPESPGGVNSGTSTIAVSGIPAGAVITAMAVRLNMTHTWAGDVAFVLKAPNNAILNLDNFLSGTGGSGSTTGFTNTVISSAGTAALSSGTNPWTGTFRADAATGALIPAAPAGPVGYTPTVTAWSGLWGTPNGNYTLAFFDYFVDPDPGSFKGWTLDITYVSPIPATGTWTPTTGLYTDAAATIPYTGTAVTTVYAKPAATTTYSVVVATAVCTSAAKTVTVNVASAPTAVVAAHATREVCIGATTTFTSTITGGSGLTYQWQDSTAAHTWANIPNATGATYTIPVATLAMTGKYRLVVTSTPCAGNVTSAPVFLNVNRLPVVTISSPTPLITPGQNAVLTATSDSTVATYSWSYNGSVITGAVANNITRSIDGIGSYVATVVDQNGCTNSSAAFALGGAQSDNLWIYPNPTSGQFQVRLFNAADPSERRVVTIYSSTGAKLLERQFTLDNTVSPYMRMDFDLTKYGRGVYLVKVAHKVSGKITSGFVVIQ